MTQESGRVAAESSVISAAADLKLIPSIPVLFIHQTQPDKHCCQNVYFSRIEPFLALASEIDRRQVRMSCRGGCATERLEGVAADACSGMHALGCVA